MTDLPETDPPALCAALVARARARGADAVEVAFSSGRRFEIAFENDAIGMARSTADMVTALTVFRDGKRGGAAVNGHDTAAIDAALGDALAAADAGLADPANDVAAAPSEPASVHGPETPDRDRMLDAVTACIAELQDRYPKLRTGNNSYTFNLIERCVANSRGVSQRERRGFYGFGMAFVAKDGTDTSSFNWAGASSYAPFERLLDAGGVRRLVEEALASLRPRPVPEKFVGDVIMTPECLGGFVGTFAGALGGYALMAGTTPYQDRKGQAIAAPCFSLLNRPRDPAFPGGSMFDGSCVPTCDLDVVRDGVLNDFLVDFYISRKLGLAQTAGAWNFVVPSGDRPIADIIAATRRGVLLCRFSGGIPNATLEFSGVAKNSFYIEDGAIRYPLIETMVSGNLQELMQQIHAISRESVNSGAGCYPYLALSGATISSKV